MEMEAEHSPAGDADLHFGGGDVTRGGVELAHRCHALQFVHPVSLHGCGVSRVPHAASLPNCACSLYCTAEEEDAVG